MKKTHAFTLIELLIVLLIVGILSVMAVKIYSRQVRQGRRMDGINALLSISLAQQRYRASNTTFGTLAQVWSGTTSPEGHYTLAVTNNTASSYTVSATATGDQANDASGSTACNVLTLTYSNGAISKTPLDCWPS